MIRFFLSCVFYTLIAKWGFAELTMMFPSAAPYMKEVAQKVQIPTHHHWPTREEVFTAVDNTYDKISDAFEALEDIKVALKERRSLSEYQG